MKGLTIRKMEREDLEGVLPISLSSTLNPWSKRMFLGEMENPCSSLFVARLKDPVKTAPVGFICFRHMGGESELLNIGVHPDYRRLGVGKALMRFYILFCASVNVQTHYLEVGISNEAAIRLYEAFSFRPIGRRKKFYQETVDGLVMMREA